MLPIFKIFLNLLLNSAPLLLDLRLHWVQGGHEQCEAVCVADEQDIEDNVLVKVMLLQTQIVQLK